jgi:peptidoglycan/xylan/chitin deacetylase (PgdA/CDA1 family)
MLEKLAEIKRRIAPELHRAAFHAGAATCWARLQPVMRIIMLHGVGDDAYPVGQFRRQVEYLRRRFRIVHLDTLVELASDPRYRPRGELVLTFDDGHRNNATRAYPILRELDVPATFFVCPGNIESQEWIWTLDVLIRLRRMDPGLRAELARGWHLPSSEVEPVHSWFKGLPTDARDRALAELRQASDYVPTARDRDYYDVMTWDQLLSLDPRLITIGSHTLTHPMLAHCTAEERETELAQSQRWLERRVGRPVRHLCYPSSSIDDDVVRRARAFYDSAVVVEGGLVRPGRVDLHRLPRIPTAETLQYLAWRLHNPTA